MRGGIKLLGGGGTLEGTGVSLYCIIGPGSDSGGMERIANSHSHVAHLHCCLKRGRESVMGGG